MQRASLLLALGIAVCLQAQGCSGSDAKQGRVATNPNEQWYLDQCRYWSPDLFFDDANVISLCTAIAKKDYEQIDRLVKAEGVDVNATGRMNMTALFWAFPLGYAEAFENIPRDEDNRLVDSEIAPTQREYMVKHARLMEHLLKLGANPNIKTTRGNVEETSKERKSVYVPGHVFDLREGLAVTHLASQPIGPARFNYFPLVMANGGDPNLVDGRGLTPIFFACGRHFRLLGNLSSPENVAILIDAGADLELRDSDGYTPILAAAAEAHFDLVHMLMHAGADFRAKNERGQNLAWFACDRKRFIENMPEEYEEFFERHPDFDIVKGSPREIELYFLDVVAFLDQEGMLPGGTQAKWRDEIDQLIKDYGKAAYGKRDPFVDEWVAKRRQLQKSPEADKATSNVKAAE